MDNLKIAATGHTPEVDFDFAAHHMRLKGESHPEDVIEFYQPVLDALDSYLDQLDGGACQFDFEFIYFNSSSAKIVMTLMELLDEAAESGTAVTVRWIYDKEDDNMLELGEEFGEDLENATFELVEMDD